MATASELVFKFLAKDQTSEATKSVGKNLTGLQKKMGALQGAGAALAGVGLTAFAVSSVKAFAEVQDSVSALEATYGSSAQAFKDFANNQADAFNLSKREALAAQQTFANFARSAGLSGKELEGFAIGLTERAADMASYFGGSTAEAIEAMGAALRGETEPIRKYGVLMDDASLRAKAMELGITSSIKNALTPQQKVLAANALILEQTAQVQGDVERTSDSLANQIKDAQQKFDDFQVSIGETAAVAAGPLLGAFSKVLSTFSSLPTGVQSAGVALTAVGVAAIVAVPKIAAFVTTIKAASASSVMVGRGMKVAAAAMVAYTAALAASQALASDAAVDNDALAKSLDELAASGKLSGQALEYFGQDAGALEQNLQFLLAPNAWESVTKAIGKVTGALGLFSTENAATETFAELDGVLKAMVASGNLEGAAAGFDLARQKAQELGIPIEELDRLFPGYIAALNAAGTSSSSASGAIGDLTDAEQDAADAAKDHEDALRGVKDALDALGGKAMSVDQANANLYESFDKAAEAARKAKEGTNSATDAVNSNRTALDLHTEAGRDVHDSLVNIATRADDMATAYKAAGRSTEDIVGQQQLAYNEFIKTARKAGLGAEAARELAKEYGLIPDDVETAIKATGIDAAVDAAKRVRGAIVSIPRTWTTTLVVVGQNGRNIRVPTEERGAAGGGYITGAGTATSDSIPARLSNGEYVVRAAAVKRFGIGALDDINADGVLNRVAKFARGGAVNVTRQQAQQRLANFNASIKTLKDEIAELRSMVANRAGGIAGTASLANSFDWNAKPGAIADQADAIRRVTEAQEALNQANAARNRAGSPADVAAAIAAQARAEGELAAAKADRAKADAAVKAAQPTAGNLLAGMKSKLAGIKTFYTNLKALKKRGLPASLLTQLLDAGPIDGADMAKALVAATPAEFRDILATQKDIEKTSNQIAYNIDPLVGAQRRVVENAAARATRDQVLVSQVSVQLDSKQVAEALVQYRRAMGGRGLGLG